MNWYPTQFSICPPSDLLHWSGTPKITKIQSEKSRVKYGSAAVDSILRSSATRSCHNSMDGVAMWCSIRMTEPARRPHQYAAEAIPNTPVQIA